MSTWDADDTGQKDIEVVNGGIAIRVAQSFLHARSQFANMAGITFRGARNLFNALGYDRVLTPQKYRWRYDRGGIVARLVETKPLSTWREGGTLVEDEDPDTVTAFEQAWMDLDEEFSLWPLFQQVDILAGLGQFAIILLGGPGDFEYPMPRLGDKGLLYLSCYSQRDVQIETMEVDPKNKRFGQPVLYNCNRLTSPSLNNTSIKGRVHYSRIIHIADGRLDDHVYGQARLERVWNLLDDLDKVVGGGAEAFWKRIDAGMQLKLDPNLKDMSAEDKKKLDEQLEEYTDGLRRILKTRGIDINQLSSQVSGLKDPVDTIISLLSAATMIPQRILMGSERGELASSQDRDEWSERISDRRKSFAAPQVVRPFVNRLIELGVLPKPKKYDVRWPSMKALDELQKVTVAKDIAQMNQFQGEIVVTTNEIRDRYLDLPPIEDVLSPEELARRNNPPTPPPPAPGQPPKPTAVPATTQQRAAKWRCLTVEEKQRYLTRVERVRAAAQRTPIVVRPVPIPSEERALTAALASALSADDRALAERLISNALAGVAPAPTALLESVNPPPPLTVQLPSNNGMRKRIEYQRIDGTMRPSAVIEEPLA
jgi:uncharacterized protein